MLKIFINGLAAGLILQLAIGPVFLYVANIAIKGTFYDGFAAVAGVTLADYIYIILAVTGVGKLLERKSLKKLFAGISSIILILYGAYIVITLFYQTDLNIQAADNSYNLISSFSSAFFLTASNPMTVVFWTGLFTAKTIENNYSRNELFVFGLSAGSSTILFLGISVIILTILKTTIPPVVITILNFFVGIMLILYGIIRIIKALKTE